MPPHCATHKVRKRPVWGILLLFIYFFIADFLCNWGSYISNKLSLTSLWRAQLSMAVSPPLLQLLVLHADANAACCQVFKGISNTLALLSVVVQPFGTGVVLLPFQCFCCCCFFSTAMSSELALCTFIFRIKMGGGGSIPFLYLMGKPL